MRGSWSERQACISLLEVPLNNFDLYIYIYHIFIRHLTWPLNLNPWSSLLFFKALGCAEIFAGCKSITGGFRFAQWECILNVCAVDTIPFVIRMDQNDQTGIEKTLNPKSTKLDLGPVIIKPTSANHTPSYMQGHGICFGELWVGGHSTTRLPNWNWLCVRLVSFGKGMQIRFLVGTVSGVAYEGHTVWKNQSGDSWSSRYYTTLKTNHVHAVVPTHET